MNSTTITIPDEMKRALEDYARRQDERPDVSVVVETALREFLERHESIENNEFRPLRITPAKSGSGHTDVSINHDAYLADDAYDDAFNKS